VWIDSNQGDRYYGTAGYAQGLAKQSVVVLSYSFRAVGVFSAI